MAKQYPKMPELCTKHRNRWKEWKAKGHNAVGFIRAWDVEASTSNVNRFVSRITGQLLTAQSDLELRFGIIADFSSRVIDLKLNYPCNPEETWPISIDLGFAHHRIEDGLVIPTLDILMEVMVDDKPMLAARDVKPIAELYKREVLERLQIARVWCAKHDIDYGIWVDETLDTTLANNLAEFHTFTDPERYQIEEKEIELAQDLMDAKFSDFETLSKLAQECDRAMGFTGGRLGTSLVIIHFLILRHKWACDLREPFDPSTPETKARTIIGGR